MAGHTNTSTTWLYARRGARPKDSPAAAEPVGDALLLGKAQRILRLPTAVRYRRLHEATYPTTRAQRYRFASGKVLVKLDFLILTALEEERDALLRRLPEVRRFPPEKDSVRVYYSGSVGTTLSSGTKGTYSVVVVQLIGMGRVEAATATADSIQKWKPRYVLLVGVAGGSLRTE